MADAIMINEAIKRDIDQIAETEDSTDRREAGQGKSKIVGEVISEVI